MKRTRKSRSFVPIRWPALLGWIALCEITGGLAGIATVAAIPGWYAGLTKPAFAPPNFLFGPVWTFLYICMGVAAYRVQTMAPRNADSQKFMALFWIQLFFNFVWSFIFFVSHNIGGAFIDLALLWIVLFVMTALLRKTDRIARYLFIPYFLWVSFAMILNFSLWILNS